MHLTDKDGNVYGWGGLEIIGPDGKPKVIDQGLTSVGLSMPSAFTVSNSPLTSNGIIGVTGAGTNLEYIDGTGSLRTFPSLSGYVTAVTASSPLSSSGGTTPNITISQASSTDDGYLSSTDWNTFNNKQPAGSYITGLSGEASGSGPGIASVTLNNASVTGKILTGVNITGGSINASDSILTAFGKLQNQINGLIGSAVYQGTWNAATNTPALTSGVGTRGYYYIVNVAGTTNLDGITDWFVGDWVIFDGTAWQQVDNTDSVTSVNGQTGAVSLTTDNIPEGVVNQYFTSLRARQALSLTTSGSSGAATYNNGTGVFNIPNYTLSGLGGVPLSRTLTINGTTYDLSADRSWNVGTVTSVDITVPTGFVISGNPITSSGTLALTFNSDYSLPTIASQLEWDTAYDNMIVSASVTGTTTKTLTLNQQDGGTITTSWTDYDTAPVTSVFGRTGAVVAQSGDYSTSLVTEGTNLYYTDARARAAISLTTTGTSGAATYNVFTGVLNIPQYQSVITNPVTGTGTANYVARWISSSQISTGVLYDNGTNVGIGTISPSAALHIASSNGLTLGAIAGNVGTLQLTTTSQGSPVSGRLLFGTDVSGWQFRVARNAGGSITDLFTIQDDGNVGIGTGATNPGFKLQVDGTGFFNDYVFIANGSSLRFTSNNIFIKPELSSGFWRDLAFYTSASEKMRITGDGNVGIGTSSPSAKLHVNGTFISNALWTDNTSVGYWGAYSTAYGYLTWDAGFARIGAMPGNRLDFSTNGSTLAMTIATDGNIGIGTTGPNSLLSSTERVLLIENSNLASLYLSSLAGRKWSMSSAGDGSLIWFDLNSVVERMRINSSGNVGIGTSSPTKKLHVASSANEGIFMEGTSNGGHWFDFKSANSNLWSMGAQPGLMGWYNRTDYTYKMVISDGGNVGIGTTAPSYKLDVNGVGRFLGNASSSSAAIFNNPTGAGGTAQYYTEFTAGATVIGRIFRGNGASGVVGNGLNIDNFDGFQVRVNQLGGSGGSINLLGGNVGIGTTAPSQKLHVEGNARVTGAYYDSNNQSGTSGQILSSTGSGTDWVDSPTATATSVAQLLPSATVTYNWVGQVIDGTWVNIFTRANNVLTTGVWMVTMYVSDFGQGGNHYTYRYSGTMTWYQGGTNQTGLPAASEIALHRMGHAANNCILYLRTTEESASDGGNGKLQINANYSNSSNTTITFTFVKII